MSLVIDDVGQFMDLADKLRVNFKVEVEEDETSIAISVSIGYPRDIKRKHRDAMRDWAAHHEKEITERLLSLIRNGHPKYRVFMKEIERVERSHKPITTPSDDMPVKPVH